MDVIGHQTPGENADFGHCAERVGERQIGQPVALLEKDALAIYPALGDMTRAPGSKHRGFRGILREY